MITLSQSLVAALGFLPFCFAAPAPSGDVLDIIGDILPLGTKTTSDSGLAGVIDAIVSPILSGVIADITDGAQIVSAILEAAEDTLSGQLKVAPTDIPDALATVSSVLASTPTNLIDNILELIPNGIPVDEVVTLLTASIAPENSEANNNPPPPDVIYPRKSTQDAPYNLTETQLRQVIYIPDTFTYGQKPPVILVPGTGNTGYQTFAGNYIPLLTDVQYADPVWLNIPGQLLGDIQTNAEYVAYAINYIASITSSNVTAISWSQGGIAAQWAFKYWPSTRSSTTQLIANSPDYHGTVLAYLLCPGFPQLPCDAAVLQQEYDSDFIATLRSDGGDSAFVPTTNVFSATDEIIQPQSPLTGASGFLKDDCSLGVTNVLVQDTCGGKGPAGLFSTHEGVLYNALGYALTVDALQNRRPGQVSDIDLDTVCAQIVSPGLDLVDVLTTEEAILIAAVSIVLYTPKMLEEPAIKQYALTGNVVPACGANSTVPGLPSDSSRPSASASASVSRFGGSSRPSTSVSRSGGTPSPSSSSRAAGGGNSYSLSGGSYAQPTATRSGYVKPSGGYTRPSGGIGSWSSAAAASYAWPTGGAGEGRRTYSFSNHIVFRHLCLAISRR
jgi:hypothetical protein